MPKAKTTTTALKRDKIVIDAAGMAPGRLATQIATILMGKHKANYAPHLDMGDKVVVKNIEQMAFTGKKAAAKEYKHHSMHPGGLKIKQAKELSPREVLLHAVNKMLPKNKLRNLRKLRVAFN